MKIGIVTLFDAYNYGAFWQAKALEEYIQKKYNCDVFFIKTNARNSIVELLRRINDFRKQFKIKELWFEIKKIALFIKEHKKFRVVNRFCSRNFQGFIFGSDEIWNFESKRNCKKSIFWGKGLSCHGFRIAYAPSINSTSVEVMQKHKSIKYLKEFNMISVRDSYSQNVLEKVLEREVTVVLDPTLIVDRNFFFIKEKKGFVEEDFLLLYSYGENFNKEIIKRIVNFAKENNYKILSIGKYFEWCDYNICCTPEEFLWYVHMAKMIVTDTFHGTVFSMIYKQKVSIILGKNQKVKEYVKQMGLEEFVYKNGIEIYENYLDIWKCAYINMNKYILKSHEFLSVLEKY